MSGYKSHTCKACRSIGKDKKQKQKPGQRIFTPSCWPSLDSDNKVQE